MQRLNLDLNSNRFDTRMALSRRYFIECMIMKGSQTWNNYDYRTFRVRKREGGKSDKL